uniref:Uncharacterized protein n=1 Tax=Setaria viridis TaxID=4556 RepID=A0A4U6VP38_SETVI|nr:hypothetical protein SEVIR_3G399100v2 [Setaria viridis]
MSPAVGSFRSTATYSRRTASSGRRTPHAPQSKVKPRVLHATPRQSGDSKWRACRRRSSRRRHVEPPVLSPPVSLSTAPSITPSAKPQPPSSSLLALAPTGWQLATATCDDSGGDGAERQRRRRRLGRNQPQQATGDGAERRRRLGRN